MTFPLKPATAFSPFITAIPSDTLNAWRTSINEALDGTGGGTYLPTVAITVGGLGMVINPLVSSNATITSGGTGLTIGGGAFLTLAPNATMSVAGTSGNLALVSVGAYGLIQVGSGGAITITSSGLLDLYGPMKVENSGSITVEPDGGIVWGGSTGHPGTALFQQYATATWQNGSFLTGNGSATFAWAGPATLSGTTVTLSGGVLLTNTVSLSGAMTQTSAGTYTQSGVRTKLGGSGYDVGRGTIVSGTTSVQPASWDSIIVQYVGGGSITITLSTPPSAGQIRSRVTALATMPLQCDGTIIVKDATTGNTLGTMVGSGGGSGTVFVDTPGFVDVESVYNGTAYMWVATAFVKGH